MITHLIDIPIYKQTIEVVLGTSNEFLEEIYNKHSLTEKELGLSKRSLEFIDGITLNIDGDLYIWFSTTKANLNTLVHELGHIVFELSSIIGLDIRDQEAICYLQEFIFEELMRWLNTQPTVMDHFSLPSKVEDEVL